MAMLGRYGYVDRLSSLVGTKTRGFKGVIVKLMSRGMRMMDEKPQMIKILSIGLTSSSMAGRESLNLVRSQPVGDSNELICL